MEVPRRFLVTWLDKPVLNYSPHGFIGLPPLRFTPNAGSVPTVLELQQVLLAGLGDHGAGHGKRAELQVKRRTVVDSATR